ncbi:MAG: phosphomannomutase/phosphoglucomutase [Gemmatimonadetes bacterium]|nr:phosphomannomutase/phosphoglucomutase [Gemmatimonadota bacterium]
MNVPEAIFRQYDIRGVIGEQIDVQVAHAIGRAVATHARRRLGRPARLAVGRDNRPSGEGLAQAVRDGMAAAGAHAIDVGMLPTPALYLALHELDVDGGLQVTGSHNPPEFNGFKMVVAGATLHGSDIQELRRLIVEAETDDGAGSLGVDTTVLEKYATAILERNGPLKKSVRVVVDCGNGVGSLVAESILSRLGAEVVPLFCESDGTFPNHHPDPTVLENLRDLQEAVRRTKAALGIAFDGDADRIGVVDEQGNVIFGDHLLALFGRDLAARMGKGHPVIFDVKCSDALSIDLVRSGLVPEMWKTGHSLIKARMKELDAPLAGEMSGHMFFGGDYYGFDDALFAAARLLDFVAGQDEPLSAMLSSLPVRCSTPEIRLDCPDARKFAIVEQATEHFRSRYSVSEMDGVRITFPEGWGLVRASNTQAVLVMRFEASSADLLKSYRDEVEDWLRGKGIGREEAEGEH